MEPITGPSSSSSTGSPIPSAEKQAEVITHQLAHLFLAADRAKKQQVVSTTQKTETEEGITTLLSFATQRIRALGRRLFSRVTTDRAFTAPGTQDRQLLAHLQGVLAGGSHGDLRQQLSAVAGGACTTPVDQARQLQDMKRFISLINCKDPRANLTPLLERIDEACGWMSEAISPVWTTHLEQIDAYVASTLPSHPRSDQSQLLTARPATIDSRTFSHIHGESLLLHSSLEGNADVIVFSYLDNYMGTHAERYATKPWYPLIRKMVSEGQAAINIMGSFDIVATSRHVRGLRPGEMTLLPSGWVDLNGGHSMKMGIQRQEDGRLRVSLYNLGDGIQYHASLTDKGVTYYQPVVDVVDVEEERFLNPTFLQGLYEVDKYDRRPDDGSPTTYDATSIYGLVFNNLGGTVITNRGDGSKFMLPQFSGTCSWASWVALFRSELNYRDYCEIISDLHFDSLCSFYQSERGQLAGDDGKRLVMKEAITNCARSAVEAHRCGAIGTERLAIIHDTLKEAERSLGTIERQMLTTQQPTELTFQSPSVVAPVIAALPDIHSPALESSGMASVTSSPESFTMEWLDDPARIKDGLKAFHGHLRELHGNGYHLQAARELDAFFLSIANPIKEAVWHQIPRDEIEQTMVDLANISELLLDACYRLPHHKQTYHTYLFYVSALMMELGEAIGWQGGIPKAALSDFVGSSYGTYYVHMAPSKGGGDLVYRPEVRYLRQQALERLINREGPYQPLPILGPGWFRTAVFEHVSVATIDKLLKDPLIADGVIKELNVPPGCGQDLEHLMAYAYTDLYGRILPPAFCALRRQQIILGYVKNNRSIPAGASPALRFEVEEKSNFPGPTSQFEIVDRTNTIFSEPVESTSPSDYMSDLQRNRLEQERGRSENSSRYHPITEADVMVRSLDKSQRDFSLLVAQGNFNQNRLCSAYQIGKVLAYGLEQLSLLRDHDQRILLRQLLFECDYLEQFLQANPTNGKLLAEFVESGFRTLAAQGDVKTACFFIELGREFQLLTRFLGIDVPFLDYRKELITLLESSPERHWSDKLSIYQQIAASYATHPPESFTSKDAALLIAGNIYHHTYLPIDDKATGQTLEEIALAFQSYIPHIREAIAGQAGEQICQEVVQALMPGAVSREWQLGYPRSNGDDGKYIIDLSIPHLFINQASTVGIPKKILTNPLFMRLCPDAKAFATFIREGCYEFMDARGYPTQVEMTVSKDREQLFIRKCVEGRWYQAIQLKDLSGRRHFGNVASLPKDIMTLCAQSTLWMPLDEAEPWTVDVRDDDFRVSHRIVLARDYNPLHNEWFLPPWEYGNTATRIQAIHKIEGDLSLVNIGKHESDSLNAICAGGTLWKDATGHLSLLERNDLNVTFSIEEQEGGILIAHCRELPGYHLSTNQRYHGLGHVPGALVVEGEDGKRKLILPYGVVIPTKKGSLGSDIKIEGKSSQPLHESLAYDLDDNLCPIAGNAEQKLYLANILLGKKQHRQAQVLIRSASSNIAPYSPRCVELLTALVAVATDSQDESPHTAAVILTALSQLSERPDELQKFVRNYFNQMGVISELVLTTQEAAALALATKDSEEGKVAIKVRAPIRPTAGSDRQVTTNDFKDLQEALRVGLASEGKQVLITRPGKTLLMALPELYDMALDRRQHDNLNIRLNAALGDPEAPRRIIKFLRKIVNRVPDARMDDFPLDGAALTALILQRDGAIKWKQLQSLADKIPDVDIRIQQDEIPSEVYGVIKGEIRSEAVALTTRAMGESVQLSTTLSKESLLLSSKHLHDAFTPSSNRTLQLNSQEITALQHAVRGEEASPEAEALCSHIERFWTQRQEGEPWHSLISEQRETLRTRLLVSQAELGKRTKMLETQLRLYANQLPQDMQQAIFQQAELIAHERQPITLQDLMVFTARPHVFTATGKNPELMAKEQELLQRCLVYLDAKAQLQQLDRAITAFEKVENLDPSHPNYGSLSQLCYQELIRKRPYDANQFPELLVFETIEGKGLYDWQISDLQRMLRPASGENPNIVLEKVMGSGKTKVYLPIIALSKADGDALSIVVVHSSQYDTVGREMEITSGQAFAQAAHTLHFTRESDTTPEALQRMLGLLQMVRRDRNFLVITDKTVHNLILAYDLMWDEYLASEHPTHKLEQRIALMGEILNLFRNKGRATLDEADLLLNVRFETVYAVGEKISLAAAHRQIVSDLFQHLSPLFDTLMPYTDEGYARLKPELIETFLSKVVGLQMPHLDRDLVRNYLTFGDEGEAYIAALSPNERQMLSIVRYQLKDLLPIVLKRRCGEHYGYSDNPDKVLPVPYQASGEPNPTAEFAFPYALLDYAILTLQKEGPSPLLLQKIFSSLQTRALQERAANPKLSLEKTAAFQEFRSIVGSASTIPFLNIGQNDILAVASFIKQNKDYLYEFAGKYLFPEVKVHPRKITSNSFTLVNLFSEVQGFTGTPWNSITYPTQLDTLRDVQSAGKTLGIIWKSSKVVVGVDDTQAHTVDDLVARIPIAEYHAYIDVSATFNDMSNRSVAEAMLRALPPHIQGVVFFHENNKFVLERGKQKPTPFAQCGFPKERLFNYYDQWHTTGTDIPIGGRSLLSVGRNTKIRDLEQGYMRDRQAESGERIDFIVTTDDAHCFNSMLGRDGTIPLTATDIIRCLEINQERELEDQLMMGAFASVREVISNHFRILRLDPAISPQSLWAYRKVLIELIGDRVEDNPYAQLGCKQELMSKKRFVAQLIERMVAAATPLVAASQGRLSIERIRMDLTNCFRFSLLPEEIVSPAGERTPDQLVEIQSLQQTQQQRMAMVQKHLETEVATETRRGPSHWSWNPELSSSSSDYYRHYTPQQLRDLGKVPARDHMAIVDQGRMFVCPRAPFEGKYNVISTIAPEKSVHDQTPLLRISDVFIDDPKLTSYFDCFDIEASLNFMPIIGNPPIVPLSDSQIRVHDLLFRRNKVTGEVTATLLSETDAAYHYERLAEERICGTSLDYEVTLYHLTLGTTQSNGAVPLSMTAMIPGIVQAKFFDGRSVYTDEEYRYLKGWIAQKGVSRMESLFVDHILVNKAERLAEYNGSKLEKLFKKLGSQPSSSNSGASSSS